MTRNQIEYANLLETRRDNERRRDIESRTLEEQKRANAAREFETHRSNVVGEQHAARSLDETSRANLAKEGETARSNLAREGETARSNLAREEETRRANQALEYYRSLDLARQTATDAARVAEDIRSHMAREAGTQAYNAAFAAKQFGTTVTNTSTSQGPTTVEYGKADTVKERESVGDGSSINDYKRNSGFWVNVDGSGISAGLGSQTTAGDARSSGFSGGSRGGGFSSRKSSKKTSKQGDRSYEK